MVLLAFFWNTMLFVGSTVAVLLLPVAMVRPRVADADACSWKRLGDHPNDNGPVRHRVLY